ncbi:protein-export chaperone SecB [Trichlorobacter ammonificans]|uniref:Protein-export protein SecB n=1 Tax=Trichlorobacter ammonificans TaxID=2916410 RepID=A0ABN8HKW0_9BACT|nr:protein-export chaperone SecB [Trichlorobacter ammonificans]CAH2031686.1 Protein-export protein SecB [Trichlorobacter ammonificans]
MRESDTSDQKLTAGTLGNRDHEAGSATSGALNIDFDIKRSGDDPLDFMVTLVVDVNHDDKAFERGDYRIHVKLSGFFSFTEGTDEAMINAMIAQNGLSMLYGVARGTVADATATSWHGKFVLPGVNFIEVIKQKAEAGKKRKKVVRKGK